MMDLQEMMGQVQKMMSDGNLQLPDLGNNSGGGGGAGGYNGILGAVAPMLSERRRQKYDEAVKIAQVFGVMKNFGGGHFNG